MPSPQWTDALREDVRLGLDALPPAARAFPGGALEIEVHAEEAPLGLGSPLLTDGLRRLHLAAWTQTDDRRALWRLEKLSSEDQARLWRRRAIVHAVIRRWDEQLRWSGWPAWQQLLGWGGPVPLISYPWAFSRREGLASPAEDLATFAEELLVPAESISPGAVTPDDQVRCRELSKSRFLDERLTALDASWRPTPSCPSFEQWADPAHVVGFEVGFAAPSTVGAQSIFGHLFLTIVRGDSIEQQQVLQMAALISPLEPHGASYLVKGLTGGYRGIFVLTEMADVLHESLELEQRSLRRFRLELDPQQKQRLLARIWELERIGYVDYRFMNANCASMLRFLLAPALGPGAPNAPMTPWETPAQVLEALGTTLAVPLLEEATGDRARRVGSQRRALVKQTPFEVRSALGDAWHTIERLDVASNLERTVAYGALGTAVLPVSADDWRVRLLLASLRIERHALDRASVARIRAERATILPGWKGPSTDALIEARQQRYEKDLSPRRRASDELGEMLALDETLRSAPRRPLLDSERAAIENEAEVRETFDAAAAAIGALPEDTLTAALDEERTELRKEQDDANRRAVPESGYGYVFVGGGVTSTKAPVLRLEAALLREELGDQRLRGFGGRSELRVMDADVEIASTAVRRGSVLVVGGKSIGDTGWGWGGALDYRYANRAHEVSAQLERLWVFLNDERLTSFILASAGLRAGVHVDSSVSAALYPRVGFSSRIQLPGSFGNSLRLEAGYAPRLLLGRSIIFNHGAAARARLSVRLGSVGGVAFTARLDLEGEWRPGVDPAAVGTVGLGFD